MKEAVIDFIRVAISIIAGVCSVVLGGWDAPIILLLTLICMDYVTGMIKACKQKKFASFVARWGIITKLFELVVVALFVLIDKAVGTEPWLRNISCVWFIICELASVLENFTYLGIPLPEGLVNILLQTKEGFGVSITKIIKRVLKEYADSVSKKTWNLLEEKGEMKDGKQSISKCNHEESKSQREEDTYN